ncbi:MAG: hypothetical protein CM15mP74_14860 [Halieaceae bacterium]|nr:MAG: hypothetical protein CM15mP74_14860 [Halieaceae bacterium]
MSSPRRTTLLAILDGFGHREAAEDNAIRAANTPNLDRLWRDASNTLVSGSGLDVGLPEGQMGNSEVGHMSLGAGRIVYQSITRIDQAIRAGDFETNAAYLQAIDEAVTTDKAVHIMGLLSPGVFTAMKNTCLRLSGLPPSAVRPNLFTAFLDGRDTPPRSAAPRSRARNRCSNPWVGRIASVHGRYWAMDRDNRWERIERTHSLLIAGAAAHQEQSAAAALDAAYARGEDDEFVAPTIIGEPATLADGDAVLFMNFRADRARQLSQSLIEPGFSGFARRMVPTLISSPRLNTLLH